MRFAAPMQARDLIDRLALESHPEGGWYREFHRSAARVETPHGARPALTAIYFLLGAGEVSRWHTLLSDEGWHFYRGDPLELLVYDPASRRLRGGPSLRGASTSDDPTMGGKP